VVYVVGTKKLTCKFSEQYVVYVVGTKKLTLL
jgi:hypothetical protein